MNSTLLKNQTEDLHKHVEKVMHSALLFSNQFTTDHYYNLILKSYNYISSIIPEVESQWPEFSLLLIQKQQALDQDLQHIHSSVASDTINKIKEVNKYYTLGLIYIVLGAMLGNKMIVKKLKEYESFEGYPFHYLSTHQEKIGMIWSDFQFTINALKSEEFEQVLEGARAGYLQFGQ